MAVDGQTTELDCPVFLADHLEGGDVPNEPFRVDRTERDLTLASTVLFVAAKVDPELGCGDDTLVEKGVEERPEPACGISLETQTKHTVGNRSCKKDRAGREGDQALADGGNAAHRDIVEIIRAVALQVRL